MEKGKIIYKARGFIYFHFCLYLVVFYSIFRDHKSRLVWLIIGSIMLISGEFIRLWSASYIGTTGRAFNLNVKTLRTSGPYSYVRNPIYLGNFIWIIGIAVISEMFFLIPYFMVWLCILYFRIIPIEEKYLEKTFRVEYSDYRNHVNRLIPKFKKYKNEEKGVYDIKKGFTNEIHVLIYLTVIMIVVYTISYIRNEFAF